MRLGKSLDARRETVSQNRKMADNANVNLIGGAEVIRAFDRFGQVVDLQSDDVASEITRSYKSETYDRAYKTGRYAAAIDWREDSDDGDERVYSVDASRDSLVTYDAFTDRGTKFIAPRLQAAHGIENANLERVFDEWADTAFR